MVLIHIVIVIAPVVLIFLPKDYFNTGQSICVSQLLFDLECYACGMTRAVMHMIHFDFQSAWEFNKLAFLVFPLLIPLWLKSFFIIIGYPLPRFMKKHM
ncbi:MAG TPA: DUF2752 domain-containing protein [Saprospiraceae bacterium]|nr:DUF2752 domain-containing protein [Saprospiraceae bacterium]